MSRLNQQTEHREPIVREINDGRVKQIDVTCRCGFSLTLVGNRNGYRVTRRSAYPGLVLPSLTACPNRSCRQTFPELVDADRLPDLFDR